MDNFWDHVTSGLLTLVVLTALILIGLGITHDHNVRGYYADHECVYVDIAWETDDSVYCPADHDFNKTLDALNKLNQGLVKK